MKMLASRPGLWVVFVAAIPIAGCHKPDVPADDMAAAPDLKRPPDLRPGPDLAAAPDLACVLPVSPWDLGVKTSFAPMTTDPMLTGYDMAGQWRCPRDDKTPPDKQPPDIARKLEPNDTMVDAIVYGNLPLGQVPPNLSPYEICPDRSAPAVPDVDVLRFKVNQQAQAVIEVNYPVGSGDLDIGLFQETVDGMGNKVPVLLQADLSARDNACLQVTIQPGSYDVVVRGAPIPGLCAFAMNSYRIRIYALTPGAPSRC